MKVGDLIRYNALAQKNKSLGIIVDIKIMDTLMKRWYAVKADGLLHQSKMALIQWIKVGDYLPIAWDDNTDTVPKPESGQLAWHELEDWFELADSKGVT